MEERLVLPTEYGRTVVPWPFTQFSKKVNEELMKRNYKLKNRFIEVYDFEQTRDTIKLSRLYKRGDRYVLLGREITLPLWLEQEEKISHLCETDHYIDNWDFSPEEVTWDISEKNKERVIDPRTLFSALCDERRGKDDIDCGDKDISIQFDVRLEHNYMSTEISGLLYNKKSQKYFTNVFKLKRKDLRSDTIPNVREKYPEAKMFVKIVKRGYPKSTIDYLIKMLDF